MFVFLNFLICALLSCTIRHFIFTPLYKGKMPKISPKIANTSGCFQLYFVAHPAYKHTSNMSSLISNLKPNFQKFCIFGQTYFRVFLIQFHFPYLRQDKFDQIPELMYKCKFKHFQCVYRSKSDSSSLKRACEWNLELTDSI